MLSVILYITVALAAIVYLLARVSKVFAYGLSRVAAMVSGFIEFKVALRSMRTMGARRSGGGRLVYRASYSQAR